MKIKRGDFPSFYFLYKSSSNEEINIWIKYLDKFLKKIEILYNHIIKVI